MNDKDLLTQFLRRERNEARAKRREQAKAAKQLTARAQSFQNACKLLR